MHMKRIIDGVKAQIDTHVIDLTIYGAVTDEPVLFAERQSLGYREFRVGDSWGTLFSCGWFHLTGTIAPTSHGPFYLKLDMNCEGLLFDAGGTPVKGFTNGSSNFGSKGNLGSPAKRYAAVEDFISPGGEVDLWIDAGMNDLFGNVKNKGRIDTAQIVCRDWCARQLYYDLSCLSSLQKAASRSDPAAYRIYRVGLGKISRLYRSGGADWIDRSLVITHELLETPTNETHHISSIGHAHLDLAWLWPLRETHRKGARTFANALRLMEEYDDYIFGASQPQLYQWIKDRHPRLYDEVKQRVSEGRWEVQGGMWVESDTNISGEEALVRQMLYGIRYFKQDFGIRVNSLWLPDVFGYSGNMPQIIRKSGLDYFMTIKISWNDTNEFPYHTFNWRGIDGSEVLAHMPPEGEYNSPADARWLLKSMQNYREKHFDTRTLNLFGVGDGGGGPSASHIERIRRLGGRAPLPTVTMERSAEFFEKIGGIRERFPSYDGELYLEKHRGTYTSQGRVKYYNRRLENKLKTLETLLVQTGLYSRFKQDLETIWKEVLLYQFHDILPGSSIKRVYDECLERYESLDLQIEEITSESLCGELVPDVAEVPLGELQAYNPLPTEVLADRITSGEFQEIRIAPLSTRIEVAHSWPKALGNDVRRLENRYLEVTFRRNGSIASVLDKETGRQVLRASGNRFRVYTDTANAWDISRYYRWLPSRAMRLTKSEAFTYGPVQEIVQYYRYGRSILVQKIRLKPESHRIDFIVEADWKHIRRMLRVAFPLNLESDEAIFDIQFGHLSRSSRNDTSQERAQYEICGQNWVDMNDGNRGAALITDSKYGFRAKNDTLDLNLIKSTNYPAKNGDIGRHDIRYGLFVHSGNHIDSDVDSQAMEFNTWTPFFRHGRDLGRSIFELDNKGISYSTLKGAEDGLGLILRLYERNGLPALCRLKMNIPVNEISETNLVEENAVKIVDGAVANLTFTPFEIKTLLIIPAEGAL